ncbi:MAG: radical SAM protein [Polyangiaceae bacterium]|nr:radical SAM protein [Polyangiaceae bacterium]
MAESIGRGVGILHVHPTRGCNLQCVHCYSESAPAEKLAIPLDVLQRAVVDAAAEGYKVLSVSGGEPLLYKPLSRLLASALDAGLSTSIVTNGMLIDRRRAAELARVVDLAAFSLDGRPDLHNEMRGSRHAWEGMLRGMRALRDAGGKIGFVLTLTNRSVADIGWAAALARDEGARLLQIHPLEQSGRAVSQLRGEEPSSETLALAWLAKTALQGRLGSELEIQLDVVEADQLSTNVCALYADEAEPNLNAPLAELISPLVITETAEVLPLQYDYPQSLGLGSLHNASLKELGRRFVQKNYSVFLRACRRAFREMSEPSPFPFYNWYRVVDAALKVESGCEPAEARVALPVWNNFA